MAIFTPSILPEEKAPSHAAGCRLCELADQRQRVVWGEGDPKAKIVLILDNPGARENREGDPFLCGTRETLQAGLYEAGVDIRSVYVTYLLKCRPVRAYDKPAARAACFPHLKAQLGAKNPQILFGFGNTVVQTLFADEEKDVKGLRGGWHTVMGLPIAFSYHPLAVRRRPVLMKYFIEDLSLLAIKSEELLE
ncbi:uracil-DNA glycosylase family protein [Paenibacillus sp. UNC499MF]|uniref:uracil-DNA glycosylase n=1 Tax=Paenibacillus sp. UNC499MF TaxID=1502751 RepID=UPI0008A08443|nr:uracil-DNA glycosylase [Paenibacillus sp. UNC499MF]SEG27537.1 DNA polymerase [Paenibacillus sp. UNC499MF]